jgi:hypothetical protein
MVSAIAPLLDATRGTALNTSQGRLLADYMLLLERNLPNITPEDGSRHERDQAMLAACLAPSVDRLAAAGRRVDLTLMERCGRRSVGTCARRRSGGQALSRAAASRSALSPAGGRGGVPVTSSAGDSRKACHPVRYLNNFSINAIAETLCFADASISAARSGGNSA